MTSIRQQFGAMVKSDSIAAVRSHKILLTVLSLAAFGRGDISKSPMDRHSLAGASMENLNDESPSERSYAKSDAQNQAVGRDGR